MDKILCIEDSLEFQLLIKSALTGLKIDFASSLKDAKDFLVTQNKYNLLLLDLSLPDGDGIRFLSEFNLTVANNMPVIIITSDTDILSKVTAFGLGVDDYICKPFHALELKARVDAKLKKTKQSLDVEKTFVIGNLEIDSAKMTVQLVGSPTTPIELTPIEFKMLMTLAARPENIFSRNQLMDKAWGMNTYISERTVDAHVSHLRKKLSVSNVEIETVFGVGYKLKIK